MASELRFIMNRRLMLISNSYCYGGGYLEHCAEAVKAFLGDITNILFIPYALKDWRGYTDRAREGFSKVGISVHGIQESNTPCHDDVVHKAKAIFIGGGNTFRLLAELYRRRLIDAIRWRVDLGVPYLGASAGANVACPTIMTTNDMPIVWPPTCNALDLFPYQINPHFIDADPTSKHKGETREERITQFHEENETPVIGIREGSWITVEAGVATIGGKTGAKVFKKGESPVEWRDGSMNLFS